MSNNEPKTDLEDISAENVYQTVGERNLFQ